MFLPPQYWAVTAPTTRATSMNGMILRFIVFRFTVCLPTMPA